MKQQKKKKKRKPQGAVGKTVVLAGAPPMSRAAHFVLEEPHVAPKKTEDNDPWYELPLRFIIIIAHILIVATIITSPFTIYGYRTGHWKWAWIKGLCILSMGIGMAAYLANVWLPVRYTFTGVARE